MRGTVHGRGFRYAVRLDTKGVAARVERARDQALAQIGEYIRARSTAIAPTRTGQLAASARVEFEAGKVTVRYGAAYAAIQHERTDYHHPNGGQAGFLRSVIEDPATRQRVRRIFEERLKANL